MLSIFKHQQPQRAANDFPTVDDLALLSPDAARDALATLREMVHQKMVEVHAPDATHGEWRVWLTMTRQWMTLTEMQQEILAANGKEA